jgi:hypothetical protein
MMNLAATIRFKSFWLPRVRRPARRHPRKRLRSAGAQASRLQDAFIHGARSTAGSELAVNDDGRDSPDAVPLGCFHGCGVVPQIVHAHVALWTSQAFDLLCHGLAQGATRAKQLYLWHRFFISFLLAGSVR